MTKDPRYEVSSTRRALLKGVAAGGLLLAGSGVHAASGNGKTLRFGVIGPARAPAAPTGYALARGYLQRELAPLGFRDVRFDMFLNGPDLNEAFFSGTLDVGIYGDTPAVVARSQGLKGRLIGFEEIGLAAWLLTPRGGVRSVKELDGKTVGVPLGSYIHRYLLGVLDGAGLTGRTKVVHMLGRDAGAALEHGAVGAYAAQSDLAPTLAALGYPVIDRATQHPELLGSSVIVASTEVLTRAPDLPAAWNRARRAALADIDRDPAAYFDFHQRTSGVTVDAIKIAHPISNYPAEALPPSGIQILDGVKRFLLSARLIRNDFAVQQWQG
ncbi:ABC transporter substrate-binding protein [Pandoraea apista]|uniref:ABC transporter substrate-binding protein n=1 Tax=Pandoraea apista TaxID=93218 RepID=UPI0006599150|nr:ABC transporter substrate-binding protein [Pandoraea apista]ALS64269.1 aliphatic sulfonate ABC transporter substrate-binding protein [Pandoraea apista]RRW99540.1 aliphatic sulfonate ABC transporter substrate-binding protein [Pandoraea apista]RRX07855.1 aliphatic sulfonate ABC transporter substrate-binding protein [Pandoraea apista]CFB63897.1 Putative aliphatic sulfonates-binding protein precursor [Pandoraea apista]